MCVESRFDTRIDEFSHGLRAALSQDSVPIPDDVYEMVSALSEAWARPVVIFDFIAPACSGFRA